MRWKGKISTSSELKDQHSVSFLMNSYRSTYAPSNLDILLSVILRRDWGVEQSTVHLRFLGRLASVSGGGDETLKLFSCQYKQSTYLSLD